MSRYQQSVMLQTHRLAIFPKGLEYLFMAFCGVAAFHLEQLKPLPISPVTDY